MMVVMMPVVVMPGFGRGLRDGPADQESCGKDSERRVRAGYSSRPHLLDTLHTALSLDDSIATNVASGTPVPVGGRRRFASQYGVNWAVMPQSIGLKYLVTNLL